MAMWNLLVLFYKEAKNCQWWCHLCICPPIEHNFMKEPIKIHEEPSLLYKTLLMVEMRSKIFKDKGGTVH